MDACLPAAVRETRAREKGGVAQLARESCGVEQHFPEVPLSRLPPGLAQPDQQTAASGPIRVAAVVVQLERLPEPSQRLVWREVRKQYPVDLVLAGRRRADFPEIVSEPGLQLLGLTPEEELPKLYSGAIACVYPSYYEGFGLPVLEAMQCGACAFISGDAALAEVGGDAAVQLRSASEWVQAMQAAIENPGWLRELAQRGLRRAREFSWARTARLTREVYQEALRRFSF